MAGKSCLLFLALIIMCVHGSAHRPLGVSKHDASEPSSMMKIEASEPYNMMKIEASEPSSMMKMEHSEPSSTRKLEANRNLKTDMDQGKSDEYEKQNPDAIRSSGVSVGGSIPIPTPDVDGGFHFQLGPIGFGGSWDLGPGGSYPVYVTPYVPPGAYVVVSPYGHPYFPPSAYVMPHQQPRTWSGQSYQGYFGPKPSPESNPHGSGPKPSLESEPQRSTLPKPSPKSEPQGFVPKPSLESKPQRSSVPKPSPESEPQRSSVPKPSPKSEPQHSSVPKPSPESEPQGSYQKGMSISPSTNN